MVIVLIGAPGSGKSTQGQLIQSSSEADWVSVGKLLRELDDPKLQAIMDQGKLVDDDLVNSVLASHLKSIKPERLVVLDGFPRRPKQARWLVNYIHETGHELKAVIHIVLSEDTAKERLEKRGRTDDNDNSVSERFGEYHSDILPLIGYLNDVGIPVYEVDGEPAPEKVYQSINRIINNVYQS